MDSTLTNDHFFVSKEMKPIHAAAAAATSCDLFSTYFVSLISYFIASSRRYFQTHGIE